MIKSIRTRVVHLCHEMSLLPMCTSPNNGEFTKDRFSMLQLHSLQIECILQSRCSTCASYLACVSIRVVMWKVEHQPC
jgi:hypothetical protein